MHFEVVAELPFPRATVFGVYRDRLVELVPYLPTIRSIEVRSRTERDGVVTLENVWQGGGDLPAVARPFVPGGATTWTDYATWDPNAFTCTWRTEPHAFREAVTSAGVNRFESLTDVRTRVVVGGTVDVDAARIKGVPRLLAGTVRPAVEQFVVSSVKANVMAFAQGVERYLREGNR